jgi:hypothetical protein
MERQGIVPPGTSYQRKNLPEAYRRKSKTDFLMTDKTFLEICKQLSEYVSPEDLIRIISGKLDFRDISQFVTYQQSLF